ncbi:DUF3693 domain-containing protein [Stenotrophomonas geniculata]|uniref:DUF3693 domain-containing protein n=1 Tax=Stenotrophomonas geniculata TaxID=86188 RepID=UPI0039C6DBEF
MTAVNELLDNVKIRLNLASDMALAERLTVTRSLVSRWRKGDTPLADERIAQICALAKLDGPTWIAMIHAERATSATERALWRLMLDRMSAAAAVVALVALSLPSIGNAKTAQNQAVSGGLMTHSVYYVQSVPEDAGVPLASITGLAMPSQEASLPSVPLAAWQLRLPPSSDQSLVHDPGDPAADQAAPRDNDSKANKAVGAQSRTFIVLPPPIASAGHVP